MSRTNLIENPVFPRRIFAELEPVRRRLIKKNSLNRDDEHCRFMHDERKYTGELHENEFKLQIYNARSISERGKRC